MEKIALYVLYFFFYSLLGWIAETIYCSVAAKKFINRGFLTGPMCPIYGTGAVVMTVALTPLKAYPVLVFLVGIVLCDIVEFLTSYVMEKLFHARWWDYSDRWLNIQGRICFRHSMYWGIASVAFLYFIHPNVGEELFSSLPAKYIYIIVAFILVIFAFDLANAVRKALDVKAMMDKIKKIHKLIAEKYGDNSENAMAKFRENIMGMYEENSENLKNMFRQLSGTVSDINRFFKKDGDKKEKLNRLVKSYPNLERFSKANMEKLTSLIDDVKHILFDDAG